MKTTRQGVFETNSSSTHVLALYNGDKHYALNDMYFKEAYTHVRKYNNFEIDDFDMPNEIYSFYDKVRMLLATAAASFWDKYGKWNDDWFMPEQVFGDFPFSLFPTIELAVRNVMARHGYEVAGIIPSQDGMMYNEPKDKIEQNPHRLIQIIHTNCWIRTDFLDKFNLREREEIERFLEEPRAYVIELEGQSEYYGKFMPESDKFDEHWGKIFEKDLAKVLTGDDQN